MPHFDCSILFISLQLGTICLIGYPRTRDEAHLSSLSWPPALPKNTILSLTKGTRYSFVSWSSLNATVSWLQVEMLFLVLFNAWNCCINVWFWVICNVIVVSAWKLSLWGEIRCNIIPRAISIATEALLRSIQDARELTRIGLLLLCCVTLCGLQKHFLEPFV